MTQSTALPRQIYIDQSRFAPWVPARLQQNWLVALLLKWDGRWRMRRNLSQLSDHMLRDIGLNPTDVRSEITKPFWRG